MKTLYLIPKIKTREQGGEDRERIYIIYHLSSVFRHKGFTLIELVIAITAAAMIMVAAALLIQSGTRSWSRSYNNVNSELRLGMLDAMTALGAIGRKSNKEDYVVYSISGNTFTKLSPDTDPEEILIGNAVEFRYWDEDLKSELMDPEIKSTAYALFYLDNGQLMLDCGNYPPTPINPEGHKRTPDKSSKILAENVTLLEFSHNSKNMAGDGKGCIRMKLVCTDPKTGETKTAMSAVFMRNVWP